ncbi:hypothetical protein [Vibrio sp. Hal054]|uniref:hypothetical protein n=1 Tax=Vibrio sp. Hal054 TaxID=3035158 RepID=UPI00301C567A
MKTATITQIAKTMFYSHEAYIQQPNVGQCRLVAIHNYDDSTAKKYEGYNDSTLVSLRPVTGGNQFQVMIDNDSLFDVVEVK